MVVISVLAILAGVTVVGWNSWQQNTAKKQVQSDIKQAASAMDNAKNFSAGYPSSLPSTFTPSSGVTVTYVGGTVNVYCIQAQSTAYPSVTYFIDSAQGKDPQAGTCTNTYTILAPAPSISATTSSSVTVTWSAVANASSYSVKYGTSSPTTTAGCASSPCVISGLNSGTAYKVNVTATGQYGSTTSSIVTGTTAAGIPAPGAPGLTHTTSQKSGRIYYYLTASGGACSQGTTEWEFYSSTGGPDWSQATAWQTSNLYTFSQITNGIQPAQPLSFYAKPRCNNGTVTTEYSGYATDQ
jgi:type II secretory pathway pseudopilin PulG